MNFENLGDKILDDQGNVKTIAGGQDARLYYIDFEGNRKKYLLEGEGGGITVVEATDGRFDLKSNTCIVYPHDMPINDVNFTFEKNSLTNAYAIFTTGDDLIFSFTFSDQMYTNKDLELENEKTYIIGQEGSLIILQEVFVVF
jgi:hypothetical protein